MFWGAVIKEKEPLKTQNVFDSSEYAVLHLSAAVVAEAGKQSTRLLCKNAKERPVIIASFNDRSDHTALDLYINCTQQVTLSVQGPQEVHLSGYFEPKGDDMDDDLVYGQEGDDDDSDEDDDY